MGLILSTLKIQLASGKMGKKSWPFWQATYLSSLKSISLVCHFRKQCHSDAGSPQSSRQILVVDNLSCHWNSRTTQILK